MGESSRRGVGGSAEVGEDLGEANDGRSRRERRLGRGGVSPGPRSPASNRDRESEGLFVNLSTARRLRAARGCSETRESMRTRTYRESLNQPVAPGAEVVEHVVDGAWRLHPSCRVELNGTRSANEPPASGAAGVDEFDRIGSPGHGLGVCHQGSVDRS